MFDFACYTCIAVFRFIAIEARTNSWHLCRREVCSLLLVQPGYFARTLSLGLRQWNQTDRPGVALEVAIQVIRQQLTLDGRISLIWIRNSMNSVLQNALFLVQSSSQRRAV